MPDNYSNKSSSPDNTESNDLEKRNCRVFVGNLAYSVKWQDLKDHMKQCGANVVRADVIHNPDGTSKGWGIVEFATPKEAQEAIQHFQDTELFNRRITVREDRENSQYGRRHNMRGPPRGRGDNYRRQYTNEGYDYRGQRMPNKNNFSQRRNEDPDAKSCRIYVSNLPPNTSWRMLKDFFNSYSTVKKADVFSTRPRDGEDSRYYGIVSFSTPEEARDVINKYDQVEFQGNRLGIRLDTR